jgi:hypothetical protein
MPLMLKGQDILVLLKLLDANSDQPPTVRGLAEALSMDLATVHRALGRLRDARLVDGRRPRANRAAAEEFLLHGFRYSFPAKEGGLARGVPTAWGAAPLKKELIGSNDPSPVWPDPHGKARGSSVEPLHPSAVPATRHDRRLGESLALLDALRLGDGRVRKLASSQLRRRIAAGAPA